MTDSHVPEQVVRPAADAPSEPDLDFDEPLGAAQGVIAYSNLDDYYFSGEKAYAFGVYTGYKYQCVEFARRYMLIRQKCIFGQCGPAAEIFDMTTVENVETGTTHPFIACRNKATTVRPAVGMTLIYARSKKMPVGHVAVISYVGDGEVGIAEQNQESKHWQGKPYGRLVPLLRQDDGTYYLKEFDPCLDDSLGWLYIEGDAGKLRDPLPHITEEELSTVNPLTLGLQCYAPFTVAEAYIAPPTLPKRLARFASPLRVPSVPAFEQAACKLSAEGRAAIVAEYFRVVEARFNELRSKVPESERGLHHHGHDGPHFRRAGVARSSKWQSHYVPNEPLAIGAIGEGHRCFMVVEQCAAALLQAAVKAGDAAVAAFANTYGMPEAAVRAAAAHLENAEHGRASVALSAGDCLFGMLGVYHDQSTDSKRVLHAELDSLNLLIDINALQDQFAKDTGIGGGWRHTSFGNDLHRALRNFQKFRLNIHKADHPLVLLDFGDAAHLKAAYGFAFANADEEYQYTIERLNHLYFAQALQDFLAEKRHDVELGDLLEKDMPKWNVVVIRDALNAIGVAEGGDKLVVAGEPTAFAWKCAPWWVLFKMAEAIPQARKLVDCVCAKKQYSVVMQPVWTHITSHPAFLPQLAAWAEVHDATATDGNAVSNRVIPKSAWQLEAGAMPPQCSLVMSSHTGLVDPEIPTRSAASPITSEPPASALPEATVFCPAMQLLMSGGKRSAGIALEGRHDGGGRHAAGCDIYDVVHPAPLSFMPFVKQT